MTGFNSWGRLLTCPTIVKDDANVRRLSNRHQRTIVHPVEVEGIGFVTGRDVRMRFLPGYPSQGIVFVRTDLRRPAMIPAHIHQVTGTHRRTTLGQPPAHVGLVEHVFADLDWFAGDNLADLGQWSDRGAFSSVAFGLDSATSGPEEGDDVGGLERYFAREGAGSRG